MLSKLATLRFRRFPLVMAVIAVAVFSDPSTKVKKRATPNPPDLRSVLAAFGGDGGTLDRTIRDYKLPDQIEWKGRPGSPNQTANVFGDPSKEGMYVQLLKRGPDDWTQPHSHPNDRYITVLSGTMLIGTGAKFDKNNVVALGPGSIDRDIANQMHYDGTGPEGCTIEIIGLGPASAPRPR